MRRLFRLLLLAVIYLPFGALMALAAPHKEYETCQWFIIGGLISWGFVALGSLCLIVMPAPWTNERVYGRPFPGAGALFTLLGAVCAQMLILRVGVPIFPWAQITLAAGICSFLLVTLFELLTWARVELKGEGFVLETLFSHHYLLYGELQPGPCLPQTCCPPVPLRRGGHIRLPNHLVRQHKGDSLADRLFGPLLIGTEPSFGRGRTTAGLIRNLSFAARKAKAVPISPDTNFFLSCLQHKSSLGFSFRFWMGLGLVIVLLETAGALSGYFTLWPLRFVPPIIAQVLAPALTYIAPLFTLFVFTYFALWFLAERRLYAILRRVNRARLGKEKATILTPSLFQEKTYISIAAIILLVLHTSYGQKMLTFATPARAWIGSVALLALLTLAYKAIRYLKGEKATLEAFSEGEPTKGVAILRKIVADDSKSPWQCFKAYGLAVSGKETTKALELARRDMLKMAAPITFASCCVAAARVKQMEKDEESAKAIAQKLLLRFPQELEAKGFMERLGFEAQQIIDPDKKKSKEESKEETKEEPTNEDAAEEPLKDEDAQTGAKSPKND